MKQQKTVKPNPHMKLSKAEEDAMVRIIKENGELLRAMFGLDPYDNIDAANHFYAGVATGIGITLKWKAEIEGKEKPPTKAGGVRFASSK